MIILNEKDSDKNEKLAKIIGALIKIERKRASYTQKRLAEEALIHPNYVREIEKGKKYVTVIILYRICNVLGIGISDFFQEVEKMILKEEIIFI
ncbi:helix-turn-helix domain-containing protein [Bacillus cereus]|uniref:helix-turn-helix domain-containing protein n=1 Tax=Bacillus cereus TaxID=1396 RepID=UPI0021D6991D|nr:helix-turn-helix domain-containing protein [Bacillus cereus]MCU7757201.1 helix-turn-helix domain-containing protein [Bacillus cereus]MDC7753026.1 helix-turn-helix domain-containing protein [Bacillus cereus]